MTPDQLKSTLWFDFENAPHVWVLHPLAKYFEKLGQSSLLTARHFSYTIALCERTGLKPAIIGPGGSTTRKGAKICRIVLRACALVRFALPMRSKIRLAISHGSRSQILAARLLGIPAISLDDYECSDQRLVALVDKLLVPFPISPACWGKNADRVIQYPGLKEEIYLCNFSRDDDTVTFLRNTNGIKVLLRPESRSAHYKGARGDEVLDAVLHRLSESKRVTLVLSPRDSAQGESIKERCHSLGYDCVVPTRVLDGPTLLSGMDLVVGGGGTMTREAAVMGIPSYSFFSGPWGAVDKYLEAKQRLVRVSVPGDAPKIGVQKRASTSVAVSPTAYLWITAYIRNLIEA